MKRKRMSPQEYEKQRKKWRAVEESASRKVHDLFGFWRVCRERACRRAQRCVGDVDACHARHWPHVPEHMKVWLRASIKARHAGCSAEEAVRIGDAAEAQALAAGVSSFTSPHRGESLPSGSTRGSVRKARRVRGNG